MPFDRIDVLINSAGRLDCLIPTVTSMVNNLKFSGKFRRILYEDVVKVDRSKAVLDWAFESKLFDWIVKVEPAKRLGIAVFEGLKNIESKYVVKWEDDWFFPREVYLDEILRVMEDDPKINQIAFNKHPNEFHKHGIIRPVRDCGSFKLTQVQEWVLGPGIWRTEFARSKWPYLEDAHQAIAYFGLLDMKKGQDWKWLEENTGCWFYGGHNEGPFLDHIGAYSMWYASVDGRGEG